MGMVRWLPRMHEGMTAWGVPGTVMGVETDAEVIAMNRVELGHVVGRHMVVHHTSTNKCGLNSLLRCRG